MHARAGRHVLAQEFQAHVGQRNRVQRGTAHVRNLRRVRGLSAEPELQLHRRVGPVGGHRVQVGGVPAHHGVQAREHAGARQRGLAQRFFGRTAEILDRALQGAGLDRLEHSVGAGQARRAQEVVAAAVTGTAGYRRIAHRGHLLGQARQGIEFAEQPDHRRARAVFRDEGVVLHMVEGCDAETQRFAEELLQPRRLFFLVRKFGVLPQRARVREKRILRRLDGPENSLLVHEKPSADSWSGFTYTPGAGGQEGKERHLNRILMRP